MKSKTKLSLIVLLLTLSNACLKKTIDFKREGYNGSFSEKKGQAVYIHYYLTKACNCGKQKRTNNFTEDSVTKIPLLPYYKSSGFDRGHLKPADHSKCSKKTMESSFNVLNISPQTPNLNRGIWKKLESLTKNLLSINDSIEVYSGPIFKGKKKYLEGKNIRIPSAFFKSIKLNDSLFISFIVPHFETPTNNELEIKELLVSVNQIEKLIKIDLFPGTDDFFENRKDASLLNNIYQFNCNQFNKP